MTRGPELDRPDTDSTARHLAEARATITELRAGLAEAEETLRAVRSGEADAIVVRDEHGDHVYLLTGEDRPYQVMVQSMGEGALTVSDQGVVLYANRCMAELVGVPLDRVIGADLSAFVSPEDRHLLARLLAGEHRFETADLSLVGADGQRLLVNVAATPLDLTGYRATCLIVTDLRTRVRLERLQARQAQTDGVLARVSGAFARAGRDVEAITRAAVAELLETVADDIDVFLLSDDGQRLEARFNMPGNPEAEAAAYAVVDRHPLLIDGPGIAQEVYRSGEPVVLRDIDEATLRRVNPDAREHFRRFGLASAMWLPLRAGERVIGVLLLARGRDRERFTDDDVALGREVADRVALAIDNARLFAQRQEAEERFRSTFDHAPTGVATISLLPEDRGRYLSVNQACTQLTGYRAEELLARRVTDLVPPTERGRIQAWLEQGAPQAPCTTDSRVQRANGAIIDVRVSIAEVGDEIRSYAIVHLEDVTARKRLEQELTERALFDDVTSLPNRRLFMDRLAVSLEQRRRLGAEVALIFCDIDHFKDINDSLGHASGDEVLVQVGRRLRENIRSVDTASRLAGDEFVVLCPGAGELSSLTRLVDRIHAALVAPIELPTGPLRIGVSIGLAVTGTAPADPESFLRAADAAMYQAKRHGRDRWEVFNDALRQQATHRYEIEQRLRDGLEHSRFRLHYQPVVDLRSDRIVAVEALLRLEDPDLGLVMPDGFIDVAEDSDLIVPIGDWVLHQACRQAAEWNDRFGRVRLNVNLSARQVARVSTIDHVHEALATSGLASDRLCLEMTERVLVDAGDSVTRGLCDLVDEGITLALDDFGTGYSSMVYLKRFPIREIKIDRSFVSGLVGRPDDRAIVRAITGLAHDLGLFTVAEGIERPDQLSVLRSLGCDRAQGFLLHRPQPAEAVTATLDAATARC